MRTSVGGATLAPSIVAPALLVNPPVALDLDHVSALRAAAVRFGDGHAVAKMDRLRACAARPLTAPDTLLAYHDVLLFLLAYPDSRESRELARHELDRVAAAARTIAGQGASRVRAPLRQSGVAWTEVTADFSYEIARWLCTSFPRHAAFHSFGDDGAPLATLLQDALPAIESELLALHETDGEALLAAAAGSDPVAQLAWLVDACGRLACSETLRDQLFASLRPYVTIRPGAAALSRTYVRGLPAPTFFHRDGLLRDVDPRAIVDEALPAPRRLAPAERRHLVDTARAMLAALGRETDAITLADLGGVRCYELGRGASIALYTMLPDRRGALDSHVGFMLFKNGLPVGYGGGWPFLGTCRIGVNVFEPYRGGESAWLFCQVLRVYRQQFAVDRFIAEPSQYGGGNKEGLASGAFWFYYRLGFRPQDARQAGLAAAEFARIAGAPGYRTPVPELRRFTRSNIEWVLGAEAWYGDRPRGCDAAELSLLVSEGIAARFRGDRARAESAAVHRVGHALGVADRSRWTVGERRAFASLALVFVLIPDLAHWPARDRRALVALMRAKGSDEYRFHDLLRRHRRLHAALDALAPADAGAG
jgi:hypothetical protein